MMEIAVLAAVNIDIIDDANSVATKVSDLIFFIKNNVIGIMGASSTT